MYVNNINFSKLHTLVKVVVIMVNEVDICFKIVISLQIENGW